MGGSPNKKLKRVTGARGCVARVNIPLVVDLKCLDKMQNVGLIETLEFNLFQHLFCSNVLLFFQFNLFDSTFPPRYNDVSL